MLETIWDQRRNYVLKYEFRYPRRVMKHTRRADIASLLSQVLYRFVVRSAICVCSKLSCFHPFFDHYFHIFFICLSRWRILRQFWGFYLFYILSTWPNYVNSINLCFAAKRDWLVRTLQARRKYFVAPQDMMLCYVRDVMRLKPLLSKYLGPPKHSRQL